MAGPADPPLIPVVDDDAAVRDSLGLLLRTAGYASCGRVGWTAWRWCRRSAAAA